MKGARRTWSARHERCETARKEVGTDRPYGAYTSGPPAPRVGGEHGPRSAGPTPSVRELGRHNARLLRSRRNTFRYIMYPPVVVDPPAHSLDATALAPSAAGPAELSSRPLASRLARSESRFLVGLPPPDSVHSEAASGDLSRLQNLLQTGASCDAASFTGVPPLLYAARACNTEAVALLLEHQADANATAAVRHETASPGSAEWDTPGAATWTALHCAATHGDAELVGLLLERNADVDARSARGVTPLHCAAFNGRLAASQLLVARGADVHAEDVDGHTALADAAYSLQRARTAFKCACVRATDAASERRQSLEVVAALLEKAAALPPSERRTYAARAWAQTAAVRLRGAAERGDTALLRRLLARGGGDVDARDVDGAAATHLAAEAGHAAAVTLLLDGRADANARTNYLDTPLHTAAHEGRLAAACCLLARGADARATNRFHVTPLEWAARSRQGHWIAMVVLLRAARACSCSCSCKQVLSEDATQLAS